jgi:hypothetical protein
MASRQENEVTVLLGLARDLEARHYPMVGVLRQLAREVSQLTLDDPVEPGRCECGRTIVQPRTGRPRKFCLECSPRRKTRAKRDDVGERSAEQKGAAA